MKARVGRAARVLGFAGLLPQAALTAGIAVVRLAGYECPVTRTGEFARLALVYPWLILAFLGGTWWGFAMRRADGQGRLAAVAVVPSLVALALACWTAATWRFDLALVATGMAVMLTLLVDRRLVRSGDAPAGWMALRVPLSLALGLLTIAAGALLGQASDACLGRF